MDPTTMTAARPEIEAAHRQLVALLAEWPIGADWPARWRAAYDAWQRAYAMRS